LCPFAPLPLCPFALCPFAPLPLCPFDPLPLRPFAPALTTWAFSVSQSARSPRRPSALPSGRPG
ncbi:MAG: hypothetical protein EHM61_16285, partial [Acidobacteria bacterium]